MEAIVTLILIAIILIAMAILWIGRSLPEEPTANRKKHRPMENIQIKHRFVREGAEERIRRRLRG